MRRSRDAGYTTETESARGFPRRRCGFRRRCSAVETKARAARRPTRRRGREANPRAWRQSARARSRGRNVAGVSRLVRVAGLPLTGNTIVTTRLAASYEDLCLRGWIASKLCLLLCRRCTSDAKLALCDVRRLKWNFAAGSTDRRHLEPGCMGGGGAGGGK